MRFIPPKSSLSTEVNRLKPEHMNQTDFPGCCTWTFFSLSLLKPYWGL